MKIVLASGSPRRRELLERTGLVFEVRPSPAEEIHDARLAPGELCEKNADLKARGLACDGAFVIGADTLVFLDGEPLGKPADLDEARRMLRRLSGRAHWVCTGVCVVLPDGGSRTFHDLTTVRFREFGEDVMDAYLERVNPLDKAGAYGIQEHGDMLVEEIEGSFDNVMGLPVGRLLEVLRACGLEVRGIESPP